MRRFIAVACFAMVFTGCTMGTRESASIPPLALHTKTTSSMGTYIKHVVVIVQENRSFENIFAGFPGANAPMRGKSLGKWVPLHEVNFGGDTPTWHNPNFYVNLDHFFRPAVTAWDGGKMDGFEANAIGSGLPKYYNYAYLNHTESKPYWLLAQQYTLADHMFPTEFGPSWTGHLSLIAGTTTLAPNKAQVDNPIGGPWGCDASAGTYTFLVDQQRVVTSNGPFPCFDQFDTMAKPLDDKGVSWRYYSPPVNGDKGGILWSAFDSIKAVRNSSDWNNIVSQKQVLADAAKGNLPAVSWVIPDWEYSDHPSVGRDTGPSWVAAVVNAIGHGPDWKSTAIVLVWDDWGGWYDNVPPPQKDFRGLGVRVGCVIISPYAKPHYVSHTPYEFGSILRFEEEVFGLHPIGSTADGYTDQRATSIADSFDFTQKPIAFKTIPAKYPASYFVNYQNSMRPPDNDMESATERSSP